MSLPRLQTDRMSMKSHCFNKKWVIGFEEQQSFLMDVHHLQTYSDSPSTFLESSVSFKNTFLAPLGKATAPLVFPLKWNELVSLTDCPLRVTFFPFPCKNVTYNGLEAYLISRLQKNWHWQQGISLQDGACQSPSMIYNHVKTHPHMRQVGPTFRASWRRHTVLLLWFWMA